MKNINLKLLYFILFAFIISCSGNIRNTNCEFNYSVDINNEITLDKTELTGALSTILKQKKDSVYSLEIVIIGYSSGKEKYTLSENDNDIITPKTYPGSIEALVKIKHNNILEKAVFITSYGNTIKENIDNFIKRIRLELCE